MSKEQLAPFEAAWQTQSAEAESAGDDHDDDLDGDAGAAPKANEAPTRKRGGRQPLARHLTRERIVHDLAEAERHCHGCGKDLRLIAEETSERYEYIPASMKVIQDVCLKYPCDCTVRTASKPPQPIEKSTAGASLLAQVIVAKWADHQPSHRREKMFERHGIEISRKTMGGWMAQCAELLDPLYQVMKKELLRSKVIGTDDTSVKVLDRKLSFARIGRIWPYLGDAHHPVVLYDYTPTRSRAGPAKFLQEYIRIFAGGRLLRLRCIFQARTRHDRGRVLGARSKVFLQGVESDESHMGPALHLIARLYRVEEHARALALPAEQRLTLRRRVSSRLVGKLHRYLLGLQPQVLPKSPSGAAVRYALNQWEALTHFLEDGELEIDNGATERANRDIALGRGNWTFFGSDGGGKTAAVLRSFVASCKRSAVEPFAWFRDVLSRIPTHSITRLSELLPHNWKSMTCPAEAQVAELRSPSQPDAGFNAVHERSRDAYDFRRDWGTARIGPAFGSVELMSDQPAVPDRDGVRERDRGNQPKVFAADPLANFRKSRALRIGHAQMPR